MMYFTNCRTTKVIEKTVYYVPEIDFPEFPKLPDDYEITEKGILVKDENYFRRLLVFKTLYKDLILEYNEKKENMEEKEK